jgi:hypothetical protein
MPRDLRQLLHETAVEPLTGPDVDRLVQRGLGRRRWRHTAAGLGAAVALATGVVIGTSTLTNPTPPQIADRPPPASESPFATSSSTDPATPSSPSPDHARPTGPSQTAAEAARDGVLREVAALTFDQRVEVRPPVEAGFSTRLETDEGVWIVSRMPSKSTRLADGCGLGATDDPDAVYRRDVICTLEYGEVLLLDHAESEIMRAFPLPGLPPQRLQLSDDAVWCARRGDGALTDGMLCRIDRDTYDWQVRVFPHPTSTAFTADGDARSGVDPTTGELWLPDHWDMDDSPHQHEQGPLAGRWRFDGRTLVATGGHNTLRYDPTTLTPVPP